MDALVTVCSDTNVDASSARRAHFSLRRGSSLPIPSLMRAFQANFCPMAVLVTRSRLPLLASLLHLPSGGEPGSRGILPGLGGLHLQPIQCLLLVVVAD